MRAPGREPDRNRLRLALLAGGERHQVRDKIVICGVGAVVVIFGIAMESLPLIITGLAIGGVSLFVDRRQKERKR